MKILNKTPRLLSLYTSVILGVINFSLSFVKKMFFHILTVNQIDPNSYILGKQLRDLESTFTNAFAQKHEKEYDQNIDLPSFLKKKGFYTFYNQQSGLEKVQKQLPELHITHENFDKLTDISRWEDPQTNQIMSAVNNSNNVKE